MCSYSKWLIAILFVCLVSLTLPSNGQMRQMYLDADEDNHALKTSFYSPAEGFVAFKKWIGYSVDSGRTFIKKYITSGNVDFRGQSVNLTFGFTTNGVCALDRSRILAYGYYGNVPAILSSQDGGNTFTLVFYSQDHSDPSGWTGITDICFPGNGNIGYAISADAIYKSSDGGLNWALAASRPDYYLKHLTAVDYKNVIAFSVNGAMLRTKDSYSWEQIDKPGGSLKFLHFITPEKGWLNIDNYDGYSEFFYTSDGGRTWTKKNDGDISRLTLKNFGFINDSIGFALGGNYSLYKTTDSGKVWEPLSSNKDYSYLNYGYNDLQILNEQQIWAAGDHGYLTMTTNAGGQLIPLARFGIDTSGHLLDRIIELQNYSKPGYSCKWFLNDTLLTTGYNASYIHNIFRLEDTIKLVVSNGQFSDTSIQYAHFLPPVIINSFTPGTGAPGTLITVNGSNFTNVRNVYLGGVPVSNFQVYSSVMMTVTVGTGASGDLTVLTSNGRGSLPGFNFVALPNVDMPVFVSDSLLCKSGSISVTIKNAQQNVRYELTDSLGRVYGQINSTGGDVTIVASAITVSGNYYIRATLMNTTVSNTFAKKIFITVEHPKAGFSANRVNIAPGEPVDFYSKSTESSLHWKFLGDASITDFDGDKPIGIAYNSPGQKTLMLIATTANGCRDTATADAVYVYNKEAVPDSCFTEAMELGGGILLDVSSAVNDGYVVCAKTKAGKVVSRSGLSYSLPVNGNASYCARYTENGVLSWVHYLSEGEISGSASDKNGNIYVIGTAYSTTYFHFSNGDSLMLYGLPSDTFPYAGRTSGFIMKLDPKGNHIWHAFAYDFTTPYQYYPWGTSAGRIAVKDDHIVFTGYFPSNLAYMINGKRKDLYSLPQSTYRDDTPENFVFNLTPDGELIWNAHIFAANNLRGNPVNDIAIDKDGNTYLTGLFEGAARLYDGHGALAATLPNSTDNSGYLAKYDQTGNFAWYSLFKNLSGYKDAQLYGVAVDQENNAYVTGAASGGGEAHLSILSGADNVTHYLDSTAGFVLLKFDADGKYLWGLGTNDSPSTNGGGYGIHLKGNDLYIAGSMVGSGVVMFASSDSAVYQVSMPPDDYFVVNYDTDGHFKRLKTGGPHETGGPNTFKIFSDSKENLFLGPVVDMYTNGLLNTNVFNDYSALPDPFVAKINPDFCATGVHPAADAGPDKTICKEDSVEIGTVDTEGNRYSWTSIPSGFSSLKPNPVVRPANTTTYVLTVTSYTGLTSRDTVTVAVNGSLAVGADTAICEGMSIQIGTALADSNTYSWRSSPEGFSSSLRSPEVRPSVNTTFYVTMSSQMCARQYTDSIRIDVKPIVSPSVTITSNETLPACAGTNLIFSAEALNTGERPVYQWYLNGQPVGTDNPVYSSATLKTGDEIFVSVSNNLPCVTAATVKSNVIKIDFIVPVEPVVSITSSNSRPQCPGTEITFQATGNGADYQWYVNYQPIGTDSAAFSSNDLSDRDRVFVEMSGDFRCATSQRMRSNEIVVQLNTPVTPYVNVTASTTSACPGTRITFQAATNGTGFQWYVNDNPVPDANYSSFVTDDLKDGDEVKVSTNYSINACTPQQTMFSNAIAVSILKPVMPTVSLNAGETTVCPDATVVFTANTTGTVFSYKWTRNGIPVVNDADVYIASNFSDQEMVTVYVEGAGDCMNNTVTVSDTVIMTVPEQAAANIRITGDTLLAPGQSALLNAVLTTTAGNATYQWQVSEHDNIWTNISNATSSTLIYTPVTAGVKVRCMITYDIGCAADKTAYSNVLTLNFANTGARLYPNPVTTQLEVELPADAGSIEISGTGGQTVYSKMLNGESKLTVNVSALQAGIYFVVIRRKNMERIKLMFAKM